MMIFQLQTMYYILHKLFPSIALNILVPFTYMKSEHSPRNVLPVCPLRLLLLQLLCPIKDLIILQAAHRDKHAKSHATHTLHTLHTLSTPFVCPSGWPRFVQPPSLTLYIPLASTLPPSLCPWCCCFCVPLGYLSK